MKPFPGFPIEELIGATGDEVVRRLGAPDRVRPGDVWWSPALGEAVQFENGTWVETVLYGPLPRRIPPGSPYEVWHYEFGETLEEAVRESRDPWPVVQEGETWWLYVSTGDADRPVVEFTVVPHGVSF